MLKRAPSSRRVSAQPMPLMPDLSFGNGASTVRQFKRVSDHSPDHSPEATLAQRDEGRAPMEENMTKEALLGRRLYSSVIDHALQETYAQTGSQPKREALARVADAWNALDAIDPEGECQLVKSILARLPRSVRRRPSSSPL